MKKILVIIVAVVATLILAGCSAISTGTITNKVYSEPFFTTTLQCYAYDSQGICTMQMPVTQYYDETFRFDLQDKGQTGWVYVTKNQWNSANVGDCWGC